MLLLPLVLLSFNDSSEDLIEFIDAQGVPRVLRGTIVSEDALFFYLDRRDGQWSIAKAKVTKVRRTKR